MRRQFKLISLFLGLLLVFSTLAPIFKVFADGPSDTSQFGDLEIGGGVISMNTVENGNSVTVDFANGNVVTVTGTGLYSFIDNNDNNARYFIYGLGEINIAATVSEGYIVDLRQDGQLLGVTTKNYTLSANTHLRIDAEFSSISANNGGNDSQNGGQDNNDQQVMFEGKAYFVWADDNDNICYHKFENLLGREDWYGGYPMNHIHVDDITDQSGNGKNYVYGQQPANWVLPLDIEDQQGIVDPNHLKKEYIFGNGHDDMGVQLDPCGARNGANSICSNADRHFRVTIYRDGYQCVKFHINADDYEYFPDFWDPTFFTSTVDISGTTPENPAVFKTYLLNDEIFFETCMHTIDGMKTDVKSIVPLNVKNGAITVSTNLSVDADYVAIKFNSRYYDHTVFEITTEDESKFYIRIARQVFNISDNFGPGQTDKKVIADFYYPNGIEGGSSYTNYDVVATKVKKDGSKETFIVEATDISDPFTGELILRDGGGGRGLNRSSYFVEVDDDIVGVYFTVVLKNALDTENNVYGGTFSGSGKGIYYDIGDVDLQTFREMRYGV